MFNSSDVAVITKIDIADAVGFDRETALNSIEAVHPGIPVFDVSAKTGAGMDAWLDYLVERRESFASTPTDTSVSK
jgi:hydrogenase nickel incorporation protein HypB